MRAGLRRWIERDPVLLAERHGRWGIGWAALGTVTCFGVALLATYFSIDLFIWLSTALGSYEAFYASQTGDAALLLGNVYSLIRFLVLGLSLCAAVWLAALVHRRPFRDFCGPGGDFRWLSFRRMGLAFVATTALSIPVILIYAENVIFRFDVLGYPLFVVTTLAVIAIQTFGEELLFRGYLLQVWGAIVPRRIIVVPVLAALFTALHAGNPDIVVDPVPFLLFFFGIDLVYYWVTFRTRSIDAAWGLHFATNVVGFLFLNSKPGYTSDTTIIEYTDPVLIAGGSYLWNPFFYLFAVATIGTWLALATMRRSPLFIEEAGANPDRAPSDP